MTKNNRERLSADNYFSIVPQWVTFAQISPTAKVIYAVLQRHADRQGVCFPSRRKMADLVFVSVKTVDRSLEELQAIGAIEKRRRYGDDGSYRSNEYRIITTPPQGAVVDVDLSESELPLGTPVSLPRDMDVSSPRDKNDTLTIAITNQSQGTIKNSPSSSDDERFDLFWKAYPRKVGKGVARKAWIKALKETSAEQIISGAEQYAKERTGQDPKYTAHPATWLAAERWTDEPDPDYQRPLSKREEADLLFASAHERLSQRRMELGT